MTTYEPTLDDYLAARASDPDTSHTAALSDKTVDRELVLECLRFHGGWGTAGQVTEWLNQGERQWQRNVVSSRLSQLRRRGLVEDTGERRGGEGNRPTIVWRVVR